MKATITSTNQIVEIAAPAPGELRGFGRDPSTMRRVMARAWEGVTEGGVRFTAYIPVVQVHKDDDNSQFERELSEHKPPEDWTKRAIDARML